MKVTYIYPRNKRVSFTVIARKHIELLRERGIEVHEADAHSFGERDLAETTIVQPLFYTVFDVPAALRLLRRRVDYLIGIDVADTDHISCKAAAYASVFDVVAVPSSWSQRVFARSGVTTRVVVLPHGVSESFLREPREPRSDVVKRVAQMRCFKFLFFLWHSGYRKGADALAEAWARAKIWDRACLIIKIADLLDPFLEYFKFLKNVHVVSGWLSEDDLVDLYDAVDAVVVPSRGGGFELNALEALARMKPVIVSSWPAFDDYCRQCLRVRSRRLVEIFGPFDVASRVHDGRGVDPDPADLAEKLKFVTNAYDTVLRMYRPIFEFVRREFTWKRIGERLERLVRGEVW